MHDDRNVRVEDADRRLPPEPEPMQKGEMEPSTNLTLVRAARELLGWDQASLAAKASVGIATVRRFENGGEIRDEKIEAIVGALRDAGVAFLGPTSSLPKITVGVALRPVRKRKPSAGPSQSAAEAGKPRRLPRSGGPRPKTKP